MAILDIFKKKDEEPKKKTVKKAVRAPKKEAKPQEAGAVVEKQAPVKEEHKQKRSLASVYGIVSQPHISEKSTDLGQLNKYTFEVSTNANKHQIKQAIQTIYHVDVLSVNVINIHPKRRKLGKSQGFKKGFKKAIVGIKEGQKIEIL